MRKPHSSAIRGWLYERSLLLAITVLTIVALTRQIATGYLVHNQDRIELGLATLELGDYMRSGHFLEATFENWESELLQMAIYVLLTVWLRQKGSAESKRLDQDERVDRAPAPTREGAPWPVRKGGWVLRLYSHSLSIMLGVLFASSFGLHIVGDAELDSLERVARGETPLSAWQYLGTSTLWFESLQNWQSEFVSIMAIVGLSVFLRERGSPESTPVDAAHGETAA